MDRCEHMEICKLFAIDAIASNEKLQERFKGTFCNDNSSKCARRLIREKLGKEFVPAVMLPNQIDWARQILSDNCIPVNI